MSILSFEFLGYVFDYKASYENCPRIRHFPRCDRAESKWPHGRRGRVKLHTLALPLAICSWSDTFHDVRKHVSLTEFGIHIQIQKRQIGIQICILIKR